jgi:hypothetical protein
VFLSRSMVRIKQEEVQVAQQQLRLAMDTLKFPVDASPTPPPTIRPDDNVIVTSSVLPCSLDGVRPKPSLEAGDESKLVALNRIEQELLCLLSS